MHKILISLILSIGWIQSVSAQAELSPKTAAFKEYCIRVSLAAAQCNLEQLKDCISGWKLTDTTGKKKEKFVYKNETIVYKPMGDFSTVDTTDEISRNGHLGFIPPAVDDWITKNCTVLELDEMDLLRDFSLDCEYVVRALKPHGKAIYSTRGAGNVELFAIPENGGKLNLYVHTIEKNFRKEIVNEGDYEDASPEGREYAQLIWRMSRNGEIKITVENTSDKAVSFILVKN